MPLYPGHKILYSLAKTLLAAIPVVGKQHDELVFRHITEELDALPEKERDLFGDAYSLLLTSTAQE